jgi:hypothetical protein
MKIHSANGQRLSVDLALCGFLFYILLSTGTVSPGGTFVIGEKPDMFSFF